MAKLVALTKSLNGLSHELGENWTTIGRADGNTFQIAESSISGRHCEVRLRGGELLVRDLQSTNGTFVAGQKISEGVLKPGQNLRVGEVELRFETVGDSSSTSFKSKMLVTNAASAAPKMVAPDILKSANAPSAASPKSAPVSEIKSSDGSKTDEAKKFHVLFVDDSLAFLETFSELCSELSNHAWQIHSAATADKALALLKENSIDLVVLDIGMPMVDGMQLLGIIARRHPGIKIAVMTGKATDANRATCLANGAELFIEKPVSTADIKVVFNLLNDLVSWSHREGFTGALRQVGLQDVIQIQCIGRNSSILEVRNQQMRGQIYIEAGAITHATTGGLSGAKAFYQLLSLPGGEFQVKPFQAPPQRTIQGQWESLLMEAARFFDEETVLLKNPALSTNAKSAPEQIKNPPPPESHHVALGDDIVVVATYDGKWNPEDGEKK